jgi:hypothetical protein
MDDSPFQARSLSAISSGDMPLLKELGDLTVRSGYRHGAPNGALTYASKDPCKVQSGQPNSKTLRAV